MALEGSPCQNTGQARWCHRRRWGSSPQTHTGSRSRGSEAEVSEAPPQSWAFSSGWKAWQESGRLRSFWERIRSHLTEALYLTSVASCSTGGKMLQSQVGSVTRRRRLLLGICCTTNTLQQRKGVEDGSVATTGRASREGTSGDFSVELGWQGSPEP